MLMGSILSSRLREDGKVVFEIVVEYGEAVQLGGHMERIYIFSEKNSSYESNISGRGKNEATKYFLIPKELRNKIKLNGTVHCQRTDTKTKSAFIFLVDKNDFGTKKNKNRD